ncbi:MAG TPA: hydroxysqualene dehydroxylase HpnE [Burkholderiaceae bacterium]|nr:hydroxysqualene dehydroxylase HpnE [Burkholderiaceae bacterium]
MNPSTLRVAVVGGGWAGLAAAVRATLDGHHVTVFEASRHWGGRARTVHVDTPQGPLALDNGQHILIGAYTRTLDLMRQVGADPDTLLLRLPLTLLNPQGEGLKLPAWPAPLDMLAGVLGARGWRLSDKLALLATAARWRWQGFDCQASATVAQLCHGLPERLMRGFIDPLCVSALNTPATDASGQVFLRVLKDALFAGTGGSNLLLPRVPLGELWPEPAAQWLAERGGQLHLGQRITEVTRQGNHWCLHGQVFDRVIWSNSTKKTALALYLKAQAAINLEATNAPPWRHEAIATVYAQGPADRTRLAQPMLSLADSPQHPAQFVFDRGQLGGPAGLLAFVVSAAHGSATDVQARVVQQAQAQLGLTVHPVRTFVEKHATFACTPALARPPMRLAPGLLLAGDDVAGPYPATLEGAMRSGWDAAAALVTP